VLASGHREFQFTPVAGRALARADEGIAKQIPHPDVDHALDRAGMMNRIGREPTAARRIAVWEASPRSFEERRRRDATRPRSTGSADVGGPPKRGARHATTCAAGVRSAQAAQQGGGPEGRRAASLHADGSRVPGGGVLDETPPAAADPTLDSPEAALRPPSRPRRIRWITP